MELNSFEFKPYQTAHELLYQVYGYKQDLWSLNFRKGAYSKAYALKASLGHATQKEKQLGFFSSSEQRKNGLKGGKRQTHQKINAYVRKLHNAWPNILSDHMIWFYEPTQFKLFIPAYSCSLPQDVTRKLLRYNPFKKTYKAKSQSLTSALTRVVKGQRRQACGWWLLEASTDQDNSSDSSEVMPIRSQIYSALRLTKLILKRV